MTTDEDSPPALDPVDRDLDLLCEAWVSWCRAHRLYWPLSAPTSTLLRLGGSTRPLRVDLPETISVASLSAFHIAYSCQPDALDKQVFDLYYLARIKPIKAAAAALGIGRAQYYRVLEDFRRRLDRSARALEHRAADGGESTAAAYSLQLLSSHTPPVDVN